LLLIITNKDDLTADFLITRLIEQKKSYFRLNSEDLTQGGFCFAINNNSIMRKFTISEKTLDFESVNCVWYRRKLYVCPSDIILPAQRRFVAGEIINLIEGMAANPSILWVNPIDAVTLAERKVFQLRLAQQLGFKIPNTLISNDANELRNFYKNNSGNVICKPIFHGLFISDDERSAVYTHHVEIDNLDDDIQLRACPTLFQQEIPKGTDVRVTIIGNKVFSAEIYSEESKPLDWRNMRVSISYRLFNLSKQVERQCMLMLKKMRLNYGAFDFVNTDEGQLYFLEVNPTGEWAWLEKEMCFPMRDAFIELFNI
jgi:glutathione synthase/RimK-type ligase-like ATP-grasp enzyme